jgi:hypothetical protein
MRGNMPSEIGAEEVLNPSLPEEQLLHSLCKQARQSLFHPVEIKHAEITLDETPPPQLETPQLESIMQSLKNKLNQLQFDNKLKQEQQYNFIQFIHDQIKLNIEKIAAIKLEEKKKKYKKMI